MSALDPLQPDLVLCLDADEARTVELLAHPAIPFDAPALHHELRGKHTVVLVNKDGLAGTCYALGVNEVFLIQVPPPFRGLRDYFGLGAMPEPAGDPGLMEAAKKLRALLDKAHLLRREDYPHSVNVGTVSGLLDYSLKPFPKHCLPPAMSAMVKEGALAQGVDAAMWAVPLLGCLAGAIGNSFGLHIKRSFELAAILWTITVSPSGSGKSPPLRVLTRPHQRRDSRLQQQNEEEQLAYSAKAAAKRTKEGRANVAAEPPGPLPPTRACLVDDTTMEALVVLLKDNPKGLLLYRDEISGLFDSMDAYRAGRGGDESRWLQLYDGQRIKINRKTGDRSTIMVEQPILSIVGTVQPGVLRRLFTQSRLESGFAARFLVAMPPVHFADWTEAEIPQGVIDAYERVIDLLLDLPASNTITLRLTPEARDAWRRFHDCVNTELRSPTNAEDSVRASLVKMRSSALRIAIVLAVARAAEAGVEALAQLTRIELSDMDAAIEIANWFMDQHALIASHHRIDRDEPVSLVELIDRAGGRVTARTLMRLTRRFPTSQAAEAALARLVADGQGVWETKKADNGRMVKEFVLRDDAADADDAVDADTVA